MNNSSKQEQLHALVCDVINSHLLHWDEQPPFFCILDAMGRLLVCCQDHFSSQHSLQFESHGSNFAKPFITVMGPALLMTTLQQKYCVMGLRQSCFDRSILKHPKWTLPVVGESPSMAQRVLYARFFSWLRPSADISCCLLGGWRILNYFSEWEKSVTDPKRWFQFEWRVAVIFCNVKR